MFCRKNLMECEREECEFYNKDSPLDSDCNDNDDDDDLEEDIEDIETLDEPKETSSAEIYIDLLKENQYEEKEKEEDEYDKDKLY